MSIETLTQIVERASTDAAFRAQLQSSPERALAGYELTADERAALVGQDASRLEALGVDARLSKWGGSETQELAGDGDLSQQWQH